MIRVPLLGLRGTARYSLVLAEGLEPSRCCQRRILSPLRLPFRHASAVSAYPGWEGFGRVHLLRIRVAWRGWFIGMAAGMLSAAAPSVHDLNAQYRFSCAQCHGLDGNAKGPSGVRLPGRDLADRKWLAKQKDADLIASILNGKGAMPAFNYKLTPEDAKRLLTGVIRPMARRAP
jgi:mono/diheme cytochrome c family protein